jgi:spectinomycin phosphotransferase
MQTPPPLADSTITESVAAHYGLCATAVTFLPIGFDLNSAVYRLDTADGTPYFLKLRRGDFAQSAVRVPAFLHAQDIHEVMAPIATTSGQLWFRAHGFDWMLYPFFDGTDCWTIPLSDAQWIAFGKAMRAIHDAALPAALAWDVPREDYAPRWREIVQRYDEAVERGIGGDAIAQRFAALWRVKQDDIRLMLLRAEALARVLGRQPPATVLCHADIHAGNLLLGADGSLAIVDWDTIIMAPPERDLMFIGGGVSRYWVDATTQALFYQGYGETTVDPVALCYYRYERIIADFAVTCEPVFEHDDNLIDRAEQVDMIAEQFGPNAVIPIAHATYEQHKASIQREQERDQRL